MTVPVQDYAEIEPLAIDWRGDGERVFAPPKWLRFGRSVVALSVHNSPHGGAKLKLQPTVLVSAAGDLH